MHADTDKPFVVQGPFTYEALPPSDISFVPLKQSRAFNAAELMQVCLSHGNPAILSYLECASLLYG